MAGNEGGEGYGVSELVYSSALQSDVTQHEALVRGSARQKHEIYNLGYINIIMIIIKCQSCLSGFVNLVLSLWITEKYRIRWLLWLLFRLSLNAGLLLLSSVTVLHRYQIHPY